MLTSHNEKANQFKIIQSFNTVIKEADFLTAQEAVNIVGILHIDYGSNSILQKPGINTHTSAVIRRLVEIAAHVC